MLWVGLSHNSICFKILIKVLPGHLIRSSFGLLYELECSHDAFRSSCIPVKICTLLDNVSCEA